MRTVRKRVSKRLIAAVVGLMLAVGLGFQVHYLREREAMIFNVLMPTVADMERIYGQGADLDHAQTRELYHRVMREVTGGWLEQSSAQKVATHEMAQGCAWLRWRARIYARNRDGEGAPWFKYLLAVRDAWTHAMTKNSVTAWLDFLPCLMMSERFACPSYANLYQRKLDDGAIIKSCVKSSKTFDSLAKWRGAKLVKDDGDQPNKDDL